MIQLNSIQFNSIQFNSMEQELANEIIQFVRSNDCRCLRYKKLGILLELVIDNEKVVDILKTIRISEHDMNVVNCFTTAYSYYIQNNKQFQLLRDIDSLALGWLHCLYH